jgi:Putative beta barrel porin-7 (BBP7)
MRNGILAALGILIAGSGIAFGQGYYPGYPPAGYYPQQPPPGWQMQGLPQQMPMQQQYPMQQYPMQPYPGQAYPVQQYPARPMAMPASPPTMPQQYYQNGMKDYPQPYTPTARDTGPAIYQPPVDADIPLPLPSPAQKSQDSNKITPSESPFVSVDMDHEEPGLTNYNPVAIPGRVPEGYSVYGQAELLYWWFRKPDGPLLFSDTGPHGTINIDPSSLMNQQVIGVRPTVGMWLDQDLTLAVEASGFYVGNRQTQTTLTPDTTIIRPFFDVILGMPSTLTLNPGSSGIITNRMRLYGAELNLRFELCRGSCGHIEFMSGPRFLQLDESIDIQTTDPVLVQIVTDSFGTHNQFWGWQLGLEAETNCGPFFLKGYAKVAPGELLQTVNINGNTNTAGIDTAGGFLAAPGNIGRYTRSHFSVLPEAGLNVGMMVNEHIRIFGGYSVLFLANAVRPGDQIDPNINVFQTETPPGPVFSWKDTTFWAQGFTVGLEIRY